MLRKYFPDWLKDEGTEFILECLSLAALLAVLMWTLL